MVPRMCIPLVLLACLLAGAGSAQVRQTDFTKRNSAIESKRFGTEVERPEVKSRWMSKRFSTRSSDFQAKTFRTRKFSVEKMDLYGSKRFETPVLDLEKRDRVMYRQADALFSPDELDRIRFNTLHHAARKDSMVADEDPAIEVEDLLDQLSLAELNRYQFRRSHSREPGLPVQEAASGEAGEGG
ncbi:MAG: hypothetical protein ACLFRP_08140 [Puniceicoccaceae bacterium]